MHSKWCYSGHSKHLCFLVFPCCTSSLQHHGQLPHWILWHWSAPRTAPYCIRSSLGDTGQQFTKRGPRAFRDLISVVTGMKIVPSIPTSKNSHSSVWEQFVGCTTWMVKSYLMSLNLLHSHHSTFKNPRKINDSLTGLKYITSTVVPWRIHGDESQWINTKFSYCQLWLPGLYTAVISLM